MLINAELSLAGDQRPEDAGIPTMVDNVLMLRYASTGTQSSVSVVKMRRSAHAHGPRPFFIDDRGFHVGTL